MTFSKRLLLRMALAGLLAGLLSAGIVFFFGKASAANYSVKDGTGGTVLDPSTTIIIKDWICTRESDAAVKCVNTTPYCVDLRAKLKAFHEHTFGCAIPGNPNYPCDPNEIDPLRTGADKSEAGQYRMFRWNYEICSTRGAGEFTIDEGF